MTFVTLGSAEHQLFETGAKRDNQSGKPAFHAIPVNVLDAIQMALGGAPLSIKNTGDVLVGLCPGVGTEVNHIPDIAINRLEGLFKRGEEKYGTENWKKGMPLSRVYASLFRHMVQWVAGDRSEDHLAAIMWNASVIIWYENEIYAGRLPKELADIGPLARGF